MTTLLLIGITEIPNGYSVGYFCKDMVNNIELFNVAAGGGYSKSVSVNGTIVILNFPNNVGQNRTFKIAIAGY